MRNAITTTHTVIYSSCSLNEWLIGDIFCLFILLLNMHLLHRTICCCMINYNVCVCELYVFIRYCWPMMISFFCWSNYSVLSYGRISCIHKIIAERNGWSYLLFLLLLLMRFLQAPQCSWPVQKRFRRDHCCRGTHGRVNCAGLWVVRPPGGHWPPELTSKIPSIDFWLSHKHIELGC